MNKTISKCLIALFAFLLLPTVAMADYDGEGELLFTIYSNLYEEDAEVNIFSMQLGSTSKDGAWVDIDTGYGAEEFEMGYASVNDSTIESTLYTGKVSPEGIVRVYGDPKSIDYINASGCGVTRIEFNNVPNLTFLNLEHNSLQTLNVDNLQGLQALYLADNPFTKATPLMIGSLPLLTILEVGQIDYISPDFTLTNFPNLMAFDAYYTRSLKTCDPSQCPNLVRLSLDMTSVETVDVSKNEKLTVLNVSDSRISKLDLSNNASLTQLYANHASGNINTDVKLEDLDLSHNPNLYILFAAGNNFKELDISKNPYMHTLSVPNNAFTSLDFTNNKNLYSVNVSKNNMDFVTLPEPKNTWFEYYYYQNDMQLNKSYKVGDVIDLSSRVIREGTTTACRLFYAEKSAPTDYIPLDEEYYSYEDGKITLKKAFSKTVFATFTNTMFNEYPLYTTNFSIMTEEQFNSKNKAIEFSSSIPTDYEIAIAVGVKGASESNPKPLYVDFGDGNIRSGFQAVSERPATANIVGKRTGYANIRVYTDRDDAVTALCMDGISVTNINLGDMDDLEVLELKNAGLYSIDVSYNANLEKLNLSGNNLSRISLKGTTPYYYKALLADVDLSHNNLSTFEVDDMYALKNLNISHNQFTEMDFSDSDNLLEVNVSDNKFTSLVFTYSESLKSLDASNNNLTELYIPEEAPMEYCNVSGNKFDFTNIPSSFGLDDEHFVYAPQQAVQIAVSSPVVDITKLASVEGVPTTFVWKKADGTTMTEGVDYTAIEAGNFRFLTPVLEQKVYCEMENATYPQFAGEKVLCTTQVKAIDIPQYEVASFTTTVDGETAYMSLAASRDNTSVFIDWNGDGNVTQYLLNSTYKEFTATSKAGARVKVLVANETDRFTVMSIYNVSMENFTCDAKYMSKLVMLGLESNGLNELEVPVMSSLMELKLGNNNLTEIDFSKFPNLYYLSLNGNKLTDIDLSKSRGLGWAFLGNNRLTNITLAGNNTLESLDLGGNSFTECPDFTGAPNIGQLWLNNNKLTNVGNVLVLKSLRALNVANNELTFASLPVSQWNTYYYNPQADIKAEIVDDKVDLSSQASVEGVATEYRWFIGKPTIDDETLEFVGDELTNGLHFTVENGVTTFLMEQSVDDLVCVMTNENLPNIVLYTVPLTYTSTSGIADVDASAKSNDRCYNIAGQQVSTPAKGIFIKDGKKFVK